MVNQKNRAVRFRPDRRELDSRQQACCASEYRGHDHHPHRSAVMAQSTRPASANGSARQDTRAAGRPARSSADGAVRSLAGAKASSPGNGAARAEPAPALHTGLEAVAATWFGEIWSRAHRLGEGRAAVADAGPDLIHDLRIYVRRLCALSDLLPRPPGARPMRRALRKEVAWAMQPLSRARDWDVFTMEVLPQLCDADPDIDPQASAARARARSEIAHDEMYANLQTERFQAMLRLLRERSAEIPAAMAERAPRSLYRALGRRLEGWDAALRARLDNAADQGPRRQHAARIRVKRLRYASEALLLLSPSRKLERYVKALADVQGALGSAQDFRTAAALGRDVCVSLSTGRLAGRQGDKAALRLLRRAGDGLRSASRRLLRRPSFWAQASRGRVARRLGPAGAEAPRATA
ncbi:hypothetical protein C2U31_20210 [Achromobacter sp. AONIH1]|nr:hypothetical protein C2U31_20210 [Achromobacter sp. AONIH1]